MAQSYGLYQGAVTPSFTMTASTLALARGSIQRNGVVRGSGTGGTAGTAGLVTVNGTGLVVTVPTCDWWYAGFFAQSIGGNVSLTCAPNPSGSIRIDRIVAQIDLVAGLASYQIVQGTAGSGAPAINTVGTTLQLSLCQVSVAAGATSGTNLVAGNLTDERANRTVCGYAAAQLHGPEHNAGGSDPIALPVILHRPDVMAFGPVGALNGSGVLAVDLGWQTFAVSTGYTVPAGYTLYVTRIGATGSACTIYSRPVAGSGTAVVFATAAANVGAALVNPLILQAGGQLFALTGSFGFAGILVPASGKLTQIANTGSYTVTAGNWFVLTHIYAAAGVTSTLTINSVAYSPPAMLGFAYVAGGGAGALLNGSNILDANNMYVPGLVTPQIFSPATVLTAVNMTLHGYLWPQTG